LKRGPSGRANCSIGHLEWRSGEPPSGAGVEAREERRFHRVLAAAYCAAVIQQKSPASAELLNVALEDDDLRRQILFRLFLDRERHLFSKHIPISFVAGAMKLVFNPQLPRFQIYFHWFRKNHRTLFGVKKAQ
jgi:hypothetical protein